MPLLSLLKKGQELKETIKMQLRTLEIQNTKQDNEAKQGLIRYQDQAKMSLYYITILLNYQI
jgi:hypothetical protein